jgi:lactate dehydrogenase-like 2-hydroxyacid dehydrogenase
MEAYHISTGKEQPWIVNAARGGWCHNGASIIALRKNELESGPGCV